MRTQALGSLIFRRLAMAIVLLSAVETGSTARAVDLIGYLPYYRMNASYNANMSARPIADAG